MNRLNTARRAQIIQCLCEGMSVASTCRITRADKKTVLRLLAAVGHACSDFQDRTFRNLKSKRIQCDEIWSFVGCKARNVKKAERGQLGRGDVYTWTAIDADTKLIASWMIGKRSAGYAMDFLEDLAGRLANRVQLTTDGHHAYLNAVDYAFGNQIDYAMLIKVYGAEPQGETREVRYSPPVCTGIKIEPKVGNPDPAHISTSYVERANLSMRMAMRRFTRLTNGFSKKLENHVHSVSIFFMFYNFARVHQTLRVTPAMEAGLTDHVWTVEEIVGLVQEEDVVILR